eukprot:7534627-Pyramimonas_sp.AAC.1
MATTMLRVLLTRSLKDSTTLHPSVKPRALIDESSFHWTGERERAGELDKQARDLANAVHGCCLSVRLLGLIVQPG